MSEPSKPDPLDPSTPVDTSNETTPLHDEPLSTEEAQGVVADAPDTADSVKADVKRALERETQDGKGSEDPGPSDFQGFATDGVEVEDKK